MKKIILSVLAIVLTAGVVTGTAYALFSDTATISGITISAGNADLMIGNNTPQHGDSITGAAIPGLYPGVDFTLPTAEGPLNLYNTSKSNITLQVKSQITDWANYGGDWGALADNLYSRVIRVVNPADPSSWIYGDWHTLREWHDTGFNLPGAPVPHFDISIPYSGKASYYVEYAIHSDVGNNIANASIGNIVITLTGTQVYP